MVGRACAASVRSSPCGSRWLGASLATASGKHINVDAVMRFLAPKHRNIVGLVGWVTATVVCFTAVWGFLDQISIESFDAQADWTPGHKLSRMWEEAAATSFSW